MEQSSSTGVREAANGKWISKIVVSNQNLAGSTKIYDNSIAFSKTSSSNVAISITICLAFENCNCSLLAAYLGLSRLVQLHFFVSGDEEHCCQKQRYR